MQTPAALIATTSPGKLREIRAMISGHAHLPLHWVSLAEFPLVPEAIEDGATFTENATRKALHYAAATGLLTLADDSGLEVEALGGLPGVNSATYAGLPRDDAANNRKLLAALQNVPADQRRACFRCVMVLAQPAPDPQSFPHVLATSEGRLDGILLESPRGAAGFGYDPLFLLHDRGRTLAELDPQEKNAVSHRGQALRAMLAQMGDIRLRA